MSLSARKRALHSLAVEQRIGEAADVAGSDPGLRVHQDRGVETDVIGAFLNEFLPPGVADVVFELAAETDRSPRCWQGRRKFRSPGK